MAGEVGSEYKKWMIDRKRWVIAREMRVIARETRVATRLVLFACGAKRIPLAIFS